MHKQILTLLRSTGCHFWMESSLDDQGFRAVAETGWVWSPEHRLVALTQTEPRDLQKDVSYPVLTIVSSAEPWIRKGSAHRHRETRAAATMRFLPEALHQELLKNRITRSGVFPEVGAVLAASDNIFAVEQGDEAATLAVEPKDEKSSSFTEARNPTVVKTGAGEVPVEAMRRAVMKLHEPLGHPRNPDRSAVS